MRNFYETILLEKLEWKNLTNEKKLAIQHELLYLLNETNEIFGYKNLPETIPQRILERMLQCNGNVFWTLHEGHLYVYTGGIGGEPNVYYEPMDYIIANPAQRLNKVCRIGKDGILMRNDNNMIGLLPIMFDYCKTKVEWEITMGLALINHRNMVVISADDDNTKESAEVYLQNLREGKQSVIGESPFLEGVKIHPVTAGGNTLLTELRETRQYLKSELYNRLGVQFSNNMKRAYVSDDENNINNEGILLLVNDMLKCRQSALEEINKMFGTNIEVFLNNNWGTEKRQEGYEGSLREDLNVNGRDFQQDSQYDSLSLQNEHKTSGQNLSRAGSSKSDEHNDVLEGQGGNTEMGMVRDSNGELRLTIEEFKQLFDAFESFKRSGYSQDVLHRERGHSGEPSEEVQEKADGGDKEDKDGIITSNEDTGVSEGRNDDMEISRQEVGGSEYTDKSEYTSDETVDNELHRGGNTSISEQTDIRQVEGQIEDGSDYNAIIDERNIGYTDSTETAGSDGGVVQLEVQESVNDVEHNEDKIKKVG